MSGAPNSGNCVDIWLSSAVPKGTTPSCIRLSISWPGTPARSKGTMLAV
jgi:hypothetical protein